MNWNVLHDQLTHSIRAEWARIGKAMSDRDLDRQRARRLQRELPGALDILVNAAGTTARTRRLRPDLGSDPSRHEVEWTGTPPARSLWIEMSAADGRFSWRWLRAGSLPAMHTVPARLVNDEALTALLSQLIFDAAWTTDNSVPLPPSELGGGAAARAL